MAVQLPAFKGASENSLEESMMKTVVRTLAGIVAGMISAFVLIVLVELFGSVVHPVPPDFTGTMEEMCEHVARFPQWVLAVVVPAWGASAFLSTWTAYKIGNRGSALVVGLALLAALVFNISKLPYPIWFKIANLLTIPTAIVFGGHLSIRRKAPVDEQAGPEPSF
jgi:hypothetical protein